MSEMRRRGDTEKCPACGWGLDADAYRCPKCRVYFCFKCRARVTERECQYQCADQSCDCYGKLLCVACVVPFDDIREVPNADATKGASVVGVIVGFALWWFGLFSILWSCVVGLVAVASCAYLLRLSGYNVFESDDLKHMEVVARPVCCVLCRHPVKHLR